MDFNKDEVLESTTDILEETEEKSETAECEEVEIDNTTEVSENEELEGSEEFLQATAEFSFSDDEDFDDYEEYEDDIYPEKSRLIQKPVLIAMIAFLLAIVVGFGSIFAYDFFKKEEAEEGIVGVWTLASAPDCGEYLIFESDGDVYLTVGSARYCGTYTMETVEAENEEGETEEYQVLTSEFRVFVGYGGQAVITFSEDNNKMTMEFSYGNLELVRAELPELKIDPEVISYASADELGVTELKTDEDILGSWKLEVMGYEGKYETYTFNADGTGSYVSDYIFMEYYGYGFGFEFEFKYTVNDGKLLMSQIMYNGSTTDLVFDYSVSGGKLLLDYGTGALAYEAVK